MVKPLRHLAVAALCILSSGCETDTVLGFAIGDISGLWTATAYEFVSNANSTLKVDLVARDGAGATLSVNSDTSSPLASLSFNNGMGSTTSAGGAVDVRAGTITLGADLYVVEHNGDRIILTFGSATFDFGSGSVAATHIIRLSRI